MSQDFGKHAEWLVDQVGGLRRMLPPFAHATAEMTRRVNRDIDEFIEKHAEEIERNEDGNVKRFVVPLDYASRYRILSRTFEDAQIFAGMLPKMALVSLVSYYDVFLGKMVRTLYEECPNLLAASERKFTFSDLSEFGSLDEAKSHIVEQEVESLLRSSHTDQFLWLENKLGMTLRKDLPSWSKFIEVTERRNLFVHTDGVVSKQYLVVCARHKEIDLKGIGVGDRLVVEPDYFKSACDCVRDICVKLSQVMWRKLCNDEHQDADSGLINISYNLLHSKDFALAESILKFGTSNPIKPISRENFLYLKVNLAIAVKAQERDDEAIKVLNEVDWSALTDKFQIANAVLRGEYERAAELMRKIGSDDELTIDHYRDWPLFHWFRQQPEFKDAYRDVFGKPYTVDRPKLEDDEAEQQEALESKENGETVSDAQTEEEQTEASE